MHDADREASFNAVVAEVFEPLQRYLRRRCSPDEVDDVLNDVLLTLWRRAEDVPGGRALPWCYGVARRSLANHRRSSARRLRLVGRLASTAAAAAAPAWTEAWDTGLQEALDGLSELDREVVRLWAWERLEPHEIATVLDVTPNAINVRLGRIRRRLQLELARQDRAVAGHEAHEAHPELEP